MATPTGSDRASQAYRRLRELIVHGRLAPGARIIETEVAGKLGISRTPVRAALQRLQQEGYILADDSASRARPIVAPLTREDADDLFEIVGGIESLGARRSAELDAERREGLVELLQEFNDGMARLAQSDRPDRNRVFELDTDFHHEYMHAAAGPRLKALHDAIKPQAERYIRLHIHVLADQIRTSVSEHQEIVDAIREGSSGRAARAVWVNWKNAAARLGEVLEEVGERGSW
ncbi:MAG: GntR family transcriptional regulator [Longimicrobiales bacterium]